MTRLAEEHRSDDMAVRRSEGRVSGAAARGADEFVWARVGRVGAVAALACAAALGAGMGGCEGYHSADVRNMTPQPVFAQIYERRGGSQVVLRSARLGPGDRGVVGPARGRVGQVGLALDTQPNPKQPVLIDLREGQTSFNVRQKSEPAGGLEVEELPQ